MIDPEEPEPQHTLRSQKKLNPVSAVDLGFTSGEVTEDDLEAFYNATGFRTQQVERWVNAIKRKQQAIFYGPPGTSKTFAARHLAEMLTEGGDGIIETVQFHSAYEYEDFVQGMRPVSENGNLVYPVEPGRFLEFCYEAEEKSGPCVLIIDEINRADLSEVFGELMYLLEYRREEVKLAQETKHGEDRFSIPDNVYLIGTMNTADRSTALIDFALRRRFAFLSLQPDWDILEHYHQEKNDTGYETSDIAQIMVEINEEIGDPDFQLGHTYFMDEFLDENIQDIWEMEIVPYLEEFFFDDRDTVDQFKWEKVKDEISL